VAITSTVGGPLRLLSPWKTILVNGKKMTLDAGGVVKLPAKAKEAFTFKPGPETVSTGTP
jgi:hypothetical protein